MLQLDLKTGPIYFNTSKCVIDIPFLFNDIIYIYIYIYIHIHLYVLLKCIDIYLMINGTS